MAIIYLNESEQLFSWSSEIKYIFYNSNLNHVYDAYIMFPVKDIVKQLEESLFKMQLVCTETICRNKPTLRTFVTLRIFQISQHMFTNHLHFLKKRQSVKFV